jgi:outer membrane biosynthesis protein TonB
MYKWVDEKGRTVFSETPPPAGVKGEKIEVKTKPAEKPAAENWKQREQESRERRAKQGVEEEKTRQQDEAQRERRCYNARVRYDRMSTPGAVYRLDSKGERVYYTDDERAAQADEAKRDMASYCR